jgi:hypothetical protein
MRYDANQSIRIHEDSLLELCEAPAVQLCKGNSKIRTCQKVEINSVLAVHDINDGNDIEHFWQLLPAW